MARQFGLTSRTHDGAVHASGSHSRSSGQLRYENSSSIEREVAAWLFGVVALGAGPLCLAIGVLLFLK